MRRCTLAGLLLTLAFAACIGTTGVLADTPRTVHLTLLHTNDTHGHLLPFSYPSTFDAGSDLARLRTRRDIGGIARRATIVNKVRREPGRSVLLVDAGDICDGTPFSIEMRGEADVAAMNAAGYDLACPGNHEFNNTVEQVRRLIGLARFDYLCANVSDPAGGTVYTPYVVREIGTARVAFFGLLTPEAGTYPAGREGLKVADPIATARKLVPELRRRADFVVALTHIGTDQDRILATSVDGIDAIVGGHSHTMLPAPLFIGQTPSGNPFSVNGTVIASNFEWGATLGRLDLTLYRSASGAWSVRRFAGRPIAVTDATKADPGTAAVVEQFWSRIAPKYGEVIGTAADDFAEKGGAQANYNLVAEAVRMATGADFAMENQGGVRAPLVKGPVTYGDLVTMDPFSNTVVTFRATGAQVKELLLEWRPAVSGLTYTVENGLLTRAEIGGSPIADGREYTVATNSFVAGRLPATIGRKTDTGRGRLDTVVEHVRKAGTIEPVYDDRRVIR